MGEGSGDMRERARSDERLHQSSTIDHAYTISNARTIKLIN
jgi:hypothetical protein